MKWTWKQPSCPLSMLFSMLELERWGPFSLPLLFHDFPDLGLGMWVWALPGELAERRAEALGGVATIAISTFRSSLELLVFFTWGQERIAHHEPQCHKSNAMSARPGFHITHSLSHQWLFKAVARTNSAFASPQNSCGFCLNLESLLGSFYPRYIVHGMSRGQIPSEAG
jgi:hypothetical protein